MGKGTDKLYITHSEWSSGEGLSASTGAKARSGDGVASFRRLPFNFCAASLQPFRNPVCTADGTIFDVEVISAWLEKHDTNPVDGSPLKAKDLIKLNFTRNSEGETTASSTATGDNQGALVDPVTFKVFTDNTHIVAVRHGTYANVFAWETVERMNIKTKNWRDLLDDEEFTRADIITLQDPRTTTGRDLSQFKHLQDGAQPLLTKDQEEERRAGNVNVAALGRIGEKVLRAKAAVEKARKDRESGTDVNKLSTTLVAKSSSQPSSVVQRSSQTTSAAAALKKIPHNAAAYTTGRAAASFTSTGLTPETSNARAILSDEEYLLVPRRVKIKGHARIETNLGDLHFELHTDTAPRAVWNFVKLAQKGYYRGVTFHRNIPGFMLQGGDPTGTGRGGTSIWGKDFADEFDGPNTHSTRGTLSMANKGKGTNSSQFFILYAPSPHLDRKHTVFGRITRGQDILTRMESVPTDGSDRPLNKIVMRDIIIYVDPFAEFLANQKKEEDDAAARERIKARSKGGADDDDRTTWTGKRIRDGGAVGDAGGPVVGKYLRAAVGGGEDVEETTDEWQRPAAKKAKTSRGFGNFDNW